MTRDVPVLTDGHGLTLRPWRQDETDTRTVLRAAADPQIRQFSISTGSVRTAVDAKEWLASRFGDDRIEWALDTADGLTMGRLSLARINDVFGDAEIGYWLLPQARGQGIVTRALRRMMTWAYADGALGRLEIRHELANISSCRVAARCGFSVEGVQRGACLNRGQRLDLHLHGRLASDTG